VLKFIEYCGWIGLVIMLGLFNYQLYNQYKHWRQTAYSYKAQLDDLNYITVDVSFYTLSKSETDNTPYKNALNQTPVIGRDVAVSRDLSFLLGKYIYIEGFGVRKVTDLMNKRFKKHIDILVASKKEAIKLGVVKGVKIIVLPTS